LRYEDPNFSGLFQRFNLAVARDEELDPELHSDALLSQEREGNHVRSSYKKRLIRKDEHGNKNEDGETLYWAHEINWIVRYVSGTHTPDQNF